MFYHDEGRADTEPHDVPGVSRGHGDRPHPVDQCDNVQPGDSCVEPPGDGLVVEEHAGIGPVGDANHGHGPVGDEQAGDGPVDGEHVGGDPVHLDQPAVRDNLRPPFDSLEVSPTIVKQNINPPSSYDHVIDMWCKGMAYISTGPIMNSGKPSEL